MPIGFLTPAERERLSRFPEQIPDDDLFVFFRLSDDDHRVVNQQREDSTRLGFALQLCALRYLGSLNLSGFVVVLKNNEYSP